MTKLCLAMLTLLMLLTLGGCGGGDEGEADRATTQPVNCRDAPDSCR